MTDTLSRKAVVFTGGHCNTALLPKAELNAALYIAADAGIRTAEAFGITPHIVSGDFDSSAKPFEKTGVETVTVPSEKDFTDTMLACDLAAGRGCSHILIVGGTGGRIDHTFSNVFLLEDLKHRGITTIIDDGNNRVRLLSEETCVLSKSRFRYFSLLALTTAKVTIEGGKYPLTLATLERSQPYAVSNEILGVSATVTVEGGPVLLIESDAQ